MAEPRHSRRTLLITLQALSLGLAACTNPMMLQGAGRLNQASPGPSPASTGPSPSASPDATPTAPPTGFAFTWSGLPMVTRRLEVSLASGDTVIASTSLTPDRVTWAPDLAPGATLSLEVRALDERRLVALATASVVPVDGSRMSVELAFQPTVYLVAGNGTQAATFTEGMTARGNAIPRIDAIVAGADGSLVMVASGPRLSWVRLLKLGRDGRLTAIAGNGNAPGNLPDEANASNVALPFPQYLALGADGNLWMRIDEQGLFRLATDTGTGLTNPWQPLLPGTIRQELREMPGGHIIEGLATRPDGSLVLVTADPDYTYNTVWRAGRVPDATMDIQPWFGGQPVDRGPGEGDPVADLRSFSGNTPVVAPDGSILFKGYGPNALWYIPASSGRAFGRDMQAGHLYDLRPALPKSPNIAGPVTFARDGSLLVTSNNDRVILKADHETGKVSILVGVPGRDGTSLPEEGTPALAHSLAFVTGLATTSDGRLYILNHIQGCILELAL